MTTNLSTKNQLATFSFEEGISTITLDDGKANVMSVQMLEEINVALDDAERQGGVVILTGREKMFSGGFDLSVFKAGDQEQNDPGHTEEQAHQQSKELPAVVFGVGEEVGRRKPTQLGGLIAQVLKLVGHATAELCSVWLSPRRFAADINREATPEDAHRSRAHEGETPSDPHRRRC